MPVTITKTQEAAERRSMGSGLVAHRKSLAHVGGDLSRQAVANLAGMAGPCQNSDFGEAMGGTAGFMLASRVSFALG